MAMASRLGGAVGCGATPEKPSGAASSQAKEAVSLDHQDPATTAHLNRWEIVESEHDRKREKGAT
jgi:hypothetical protein